MPMTYYIQKKKFPGLKEKESIIPIHTELFRTTDVTGVCELPAGTEMCMPGDNVEMTIELIHPVAMEQGLTFAIREGGRTVGSGRVATVIE